MRVPTNTLYQNISIIRRGFRAVGDTTHSLIATVPRRGFKIHNDINIQNHVINSSTDAHTHNAPPAIKVNAGYKESIGGAKNFNNKILKHIKSHLIMLSAFVIGAYSAYWLWNNNQPKPFFKDYKTVAEKKELYDFTPESIYRAMTIFDRLQNKSDIQTLKTECYCLLAECHMSLALHGKSELELAAQKALELLDYVSDITTVDGKILAIMGLITGLSGQAKVSHILFEQAKIHSTDIASLYYYRALVNFHNEKIEEARICIDKSLQLEPRRRKAVVIKECVDMYVPNPLKNNMKLYYKETESESHRVIIDNILKLKQLTRICMR